MTDREREARAAYLRWLADYLYTSGQHDRDAVGWSAFQAGAAWQSAHASARGEDMVLAPREPTREMQWAGGDAFHTYRRSVHVMVDTDIATAIYRAMLRALAQDKEPK